MSKCQLPSSVLLLLITILDLFRCFKKFKIAHDLTNSREGLTHATLCVIRDFAKDNVVYVELRTTPKQNENMSKTEYLECVLESIW